MTKQVDGLATEEDLDPQTTDTASAPETQDPLPQDSQDEDVVSRKEFDELVKRTRGLQSSRDKQKDTLDGFSERLGKLDLTPEQQVQLKEMTLEDRLAALEEGKLSSQANGVVAPEAEETVDFAGVLKDDHGFDLATLTPEQIKLVLTAETKVELNTIALKMKAGQTETLASTSGLVQDAGGGAQPKISGDKVALTKEYQSYHGKSGDAEIPGSDQTYAERQTEISKELKEIEENE